MAKVTAPLLAFSARGTIGKTATFATWKGRPYGRIWVSPANPQTAAQTQTRSVFGWLQFTWKVAPPDFTAAWTEYAKGKVMTNRNAFASVNVGLLRPAADLADFIFSPGAGGGLSPLSQIVTPGAGSLTIAVTPPAPPSGWTITRVIAAAIADQDPHTGTLYTMTAGEDLTTPYSIVLSGLTAAQLYRVGAWIEWAKPDGSVAYSPSIQSSGTPT